MVPRGGPPTSFESILTVEELNNLEYLQATVQARAVTTNMRHVDLLTEWLLI